MDALEAIKLAIEDHRAYCQKIGCVPDFEFIAALREAERLIAEQREQEAA